ncbi:MAG: 50S ribosomal protein L22 [Candidatus Margulisbacteria bacterium]|nr:50S ribosomal protein L22 [Candidatus Margulisiibacteriota bacterium]
MDVKAKTKYCRMAARKIRLAVNLVKGQFAEDALTTLKFTNKKAAALLEKTLRSAIANAHGKEGIDIDRLRIKEAFVDEGPTWRRFMPRAMGRTTRINKRTSHITVILTDKVS